MTIPNDGPPYESDMRANTSSGLGGLFSQLAAIAAGIAALPQLLIAVQQIAADLRKFVGTADDFGNWAGIINYLQYVVGNYGPAELINNPIDGKLNSIVGLTTVLRTGLFGATNNPSAAQLTAIRNALVDSLLPGVAGLQAQLNSTNNVLGDVNGAPIGSTIKDLLRSIDVNALRSAECCEDGSNPDPDPDPIVNQPPSPETRCATEEGPLRATAYVPASVNLAGDDLYFIEFAGVEAASGAVMTNSLDQYLAFPDMPTISVDVPLEVCIDWNLTGDIHPGQLFFRRFSRPDQIDSGFSSLVPNLFDDQQSSQLYEVTEGQSFAFYLTVPTGTPPPGLNFFLNWTETVG